MVAAGLARCYVILKVWHSIYFLLLAATFWEDFGGYATRKLVEVTWIFVAKLQYKTEEEEEGSL